MQYLIVPIDSLLVLQRRPHLVQFILIDIHYARKPISSVKMNTNLNENWLRTKQNYTFESHSTMVRVLRPWSCRRTESALKVSVLLGGWAGSQQRGSAINSVAIKLVQSQRRSKPVIISNHRKICIHSSTRNSWTWDHCGGERRVDQ